MAAYKVTFRFARDEYGGIDTVEANENIAQTLRRLLDAKGITTLRQFSPSRNSVKVIFPSESELNRALDERPYFQENNCSPRISMALKAKRTVFCSGFDLTLLRTYNKNEIIRELKKNKWDIEDVYLMNNGASFKIQFKSTLQATKFIGNTNTGIGGIKLMQQHKEK